MFVDGVVAFNEVTDLAKRSKKPICLILRKCISMLELFGLYSCHIFFNEKCRAWKRDYMIDGNLRVLVNGCQTQEIRI